MKIGNQAFILTISRLANYGLMLLAPLVLVRLMPVTDFGQYREFILYGGILYSLASFQINESLLFFVPANPESPWRVVRTTLQMSAVSSVLVVAVLVALDLGTGDVRNYQQAGLIAYAGDDDFARLDVVSIWNTRQIEYGRELPYAGALAYGGITVGTPATTTWLRLVQRVDPATGEHRLRSESSTDGRTWTIGGVWTFPAGSPPRIGLDAHGGATPAVTAHFDYVRIYQP